jgi:hypothetical protein
MSGWEDEREPVVGEEVLISAGGPFIPVGIEAVRPDGGIKLLVRQKSG